MPRNKYHDTPIVEFHEAFGAPVAWNPTIPPADRRKLRCTLLLEEVIEFCNASGFDVEVSRDGVSLPPNGQPPNLVLAADGLGDCRVIIDGGNLEWGFPGEKILREIHRSNMSKLGEDGRPILREDGKILKGPHFTLPQIDNILELYKGIQNG